MGGLITSLGLGAGGNSAAAGANFQAAGTNIINPVGVNDIPAAQGNVNTALTQQQAFTQALQAQNGVGNQSNVFNQLGGIANGTGPNPAAAALAQSTSANTANQAALMASQRGAGANTGLIARQAAQQGGANQQQSAGQAATMQANQSLNALNLQGGIAGQQVSNQAGATQNLNVSSQNEQQNLLNAIAAQNNANVAMQSNQNSSNAGVAQQVARNQANLASSLSGGVANSGILGALAGGVGAAANGIGSALGLGSSPDDPNYGTSEGEGAADDTTYGIDPSTGAQEGAGTFGPAADVVEELNKGGKVPAKKKAYADGGDVSDEQYGSSDESGNAPTSANQTQQAASNSMPAQQSFMPSQAEPTVTNEVSTGPKSSVGKFLTNPSPTALTASASPDFSSGVQDSSAGNLGKGISAGMINSAVRGPTNYGSGDWEDTAEGIGDTIIGAVAAAGSGMAPAFAATSAANAASNSQSGPSGDSNLAKGGTAKGHKSGKVPAMVSPGEMYLPPKKAQAVAAKKAPPMIGEMIPGKAKVKGDSLKNDTVPKTLETGGVVIPRSIMNHPDAAKKAAAFVAAHLAKSGHMPKRPK